MGTPTFSPLCSESSLVHTGTASQLMAPVPHQSARCYCKFVELINNNGKASYREAVQLLVACCRHPPQPQHQEDKRNHHWHLEVEGQTALSPEHQLRRIEAGKSTSFTDQNKGFEWTVNMFYIIKKQQHLFFLIMLRGNKVSQPPLKNFCHCKIESVLTQGCKVKYTSSTASKKKQLLWIFKTAQLRFPLPCKLGAD